MLGKEQAIEFTPGLRLKSDARYASTYAPGENRAFEELFNTKMGQ
jgi:hypothetical protein